MRTYKPFVYNNLEEFLSDIVTCPAKQLGSSEDQSHWNGGEMSFEVAMDKVRYGYDLDKLAAKIDGLETIGTAQMDFVHDVTGSVVDMGAYLEGIPENMIDFPLIDNKKFIQVYVNVCEHCGVSAEQIFNKAAATAALVDYLESEQNYRVELSVVYPVDRISRSEENHMISVKVKNFQEKLSIGQIAGSVAPMFQRRMMFRHNEKHAYPVNYGYGSTDSDFKEAIRMVADVSVEIIYLPNTLQSGSLGCKDSGHRTKEESMKWAQHFMTNKIDLTVKK